MILVTGAAGHIGNVLLRQLTGRNIPVRALILPGESSSYLEGQDIELVEGDVLDYQALLSACEGVDIVFHLAGLISIMPGENPLVRLVNIQGTRNVIQAVKDKGVRRLIYTSSIHAFKRVPHGITIDENIPFDNEHAISDYDFSKATASKAILNAVQEGVDAVIVCPTGVIGPFDYKGSEMGNILSDCLKNNLQLYIDGAYDFVDVRDVASGLILTAEIGRCGETYILSGEQITVRELLDTIQDISGRKLIMVKIPINFARLVAKIATTYYTITRKKPRFTPYSIETLLSNSKISRNKAESELGFKPRPLTEAISDSLSWCKNHKDFHVDYS